MSISEDIPTAPQRRCGRWTWVRPCNICGNLTYFLIGRRADGLQVARCDRCGMGVLEVLPSRQKRSTPTNTTPAPERPGRSVMRTKPHRGARRLVGGSPRSASSDP